MLRNILCFGIAYCRPMNVTISADWSVKVTELAVLPAAATSRADLSIGGVDSCIVATPEGVFADPAMIGAPLVQAIDAIFLSNRYLVGLDYPVFMRALFGHGAALPVDMTGSTLVRLAAAIEPFTPQRRLLYRSVRLADEVANYQFETLYAAGPDGKEQPTQLDIDEFVADLWTKGVRFGVDLDAIRTAIASGSVAREIVAHRLAPIKGDDASVEEVASELRRNDAPRQLANGKLDLLSFENRFPQIKTGKRLLRKIPATVGVPGIDLGGRPIAPELPADVDLSDYAGEGTAVDVGADGEFLIAACDGFLSIDASHDRIAITNKIISRDGVSAKTTGNLQLQGDYEEFGEIQEQRSIEGTSITVHADVYGHLISRGGLICLKRNLVGGSARNANGNIEVQGVASSSSLQSTNGAVILKRAENCIIAAARVRVEQAVNCEIIGDDIEIGHAEGCAIAGRSIRIGRAAPRRQGEMLVYALRPDCDSLDTALTQVRTRIAQLATQVAQCRSTMEALATQEEVRKYLRVASRVRSGEMALVGEQVAQFQALTERTAPALREVAQLSQQAKKAELERQAGLIYEQQYETERRTRLGQGGVQILTLDGDVQVRALPYEPEAGSFWDVAPRDVKQRLRDSSGTELLFAGCSGGWDWTLGSAVES